MQEQHNTGDNKQSQGGIETGANSQGKHNDPYLVEQFQRSDLNRNQPIKVEDRQNEGRKRLVKSRIPSK